ncbi:response regulator [Brevibacillus invocatus]|uniref:Response regulator n=1 Tax=Brevibacillus invocatus TaxID=173959 RepID=A0A3M8CH90_9BACL|nr:response regulator [Brevibacillus invocatus]RNB74185.1 response regulator [Brevibacillus invocatus]
MYKLLLVDDEEDVREGVSQEIDWEGFGFQIAAKAENGKEAWELVERLRPDLVVTDIKMPFMDGLQLAGLIREHYPATRIMILTGFDEFDYAQKAVRLDIDEYVLKPFSAVELIEGLLKVKKRMDEEAAYRENVQLLRESYEKSLPVLREVFLTSLMSANKLTRAEIMEKAREYGIKLGASAYLVATLCLDERNQEDRQLCLFAVKNIAQEYLGSSCPALLFHHNDQLVLLFLADDADNERKLYQRIQPVLEEIRRTVDKYMSFTVTIGIGTTVHDLTELAYSYENAMLALDYKAILGNNQLLFLEDVEQHTREKLRFDERKEHELVRCIKMGTYPELMTVMDELFREVEQGHVAIQEYRIYLLEIVTTILKTAKRTESESDTSQEWGGASDFLAEISTCNNLEEAKQILTLTCQKIMTRIAAGRHSSNKRLVDQAIDYTHRHYQSPDISIHRICAALHISPGYFSSLFKKETNMTFVTYLQSLRMEKAQELLRTTDLKTFEIAERVGFTDSNYFSFCFRKHVGISAKAYRNEVLEG